MQEKYNEFPYTFHLELQIDIILSNLFYFLYIDTALMWVHINHESIILMFFVLNPLRVNCIYHDSAFKYFSMYFLRTRTFSYTSMIQWSNLGNVALLDISYIQSKFNFCQLSQYSLFIFFQWSRIQPRITHSMQLISLFILPQPTSVLTFLVFHQISITEECMPVVSQNNSQFRLVWEFPCDYTKYHVRSYA